MTPVNRIPVKSPADAARRATAGLPIPHNDLKALESSVYELCLNVRQWADGPGEVSVERDESHIIITVQDEGVGIPAAMRRAFPDLDDEAAVVKALEAGGSSSGERWRGFGLAGAVDLTSRGFVVYLESRGAAVWIEDRRTTFCYKSGGSVTGTRIQVIYPAGEPDA